MQSLEAAERFYSLDLASLSDVDLWAEHLLLTRHLARRLYRRCPDRLIVHGASCDVMPENDWLRSRIRDLAAEAKRRRARRAA